MRFDPSQAVKFDMGRGRIQLDGPVSRVLVPADALVGLAKAAGEEALRDFGRQLGTEAGRRAAGRFGDAATPEAVVEHLGGDLALSGLGSLSIERWGRALVLVVGGSPFGADGDPLLCAVFEGALQRGLGRTVEVVLLARDGDSARLLVVNPAAAAKVRAWLADGTAWGDVLAKLHERGAS